MLVSESAQNANYTYQPSNDSRMMNNIQSNMPLHHIEQPPVHMPNPMPVSMDTMPLAQSTTPTDIMQYASDLYQHLNQTPHPNQRSHPLAPEMTLNSVYYAAVPPPEAAVSTTTEYYGPHPKVEMVRLPPGYEQKIQPPEAIDYSR